MMEAMVLAAGAGTRLGPLTDRKPKALIEVQGRPLLSYAIDRLVAAGATRIIINTHYHHEQIEAFVAQHAPPKVKIKLSREPDGPYDTGGGLLAAAPLFRENGPFLLHNVDVLSNVPLDRLVSDHVTARERGAGRLVASVAVQARNANRQLLFDAQGLLGWENRGSDGSMLASRRVRDPVGVLTRWSFTGIHVLEPAVFDLCQRTGSFSIVTWYLDLAQQGHAIVPIDVSEHQWIDVGTPERLAEAEALKPIAR